MATQHSFDTSMAHHPDIVALRDRFDRAAGTPRAQVAEGLMVVAGGYAAISPWVIGFSGTTTPLAINDLIVGVAIMVMTLVCADSRGRMYGMAWVAPVMGVWLIVANWLMNGINPATGTMISNIIVGACVLVLGAAVMGVTTMKPEQT
ncbi:SPW repeat protein [Flexivirga sp. B27]